MKNSTLNENDSIELINKLKLRFEKNNHRHPNLNWNEIHSKLKNSPNILYSLFQMEETGGEPDVFVFKNDGNIYFVDFSAESPKGRRSYCYDQEALESRKQHKPEHSAVGFGNEIGVELLSEDEYKEIQNYNKLDTKTSSWLKTPKEIRELGGAIFGDYRFGRVFIYHNGAESYYGVRGFRSKLKI